MPRRTFAVPNVCVAPRSTAVPKLFAEEPLPYEDIAGYADLRQRTSTPIAGGEMLAGLHEFAAFINARALELPSPSTLRLKSSIPSTRWTTLLPSI